MRTLLFVWALALAAPLPAQEPETRRDSALRDRALPRDVALEVTALYNRPAALRASGSLEIPIEQDVTGDVAVLNGPLSIAGRVRGRVVVINGDVILRSTARIDGDLFVVGGVIEGADQAYIGGEIQSYRQVLRYYHEGDQLVADVDRVERAPDDDERWTGRWRRQRVSSSSRIGVGTGGGYNRVEGLPIFAGPRIRHSAPWGRLRLEAYGILRSADKFDWTSENLGHDVRAELRLGQRAGISIGGQLFDVVDAVENWHLQDAEVGLATFFLHRDYRDYFERHGGTVSAGLFAGDELGLTFALSDQRWRSRVERDPWTLFRNAQGWRPNPQVDEGDFRIASVTLRIDTRNDRDDPWSGWFITGDVERGTSEAAMLAPTSPFVREGSPTGVPVAVTYTRGFLDLRRYNRVSPEGQLNVRVVLGGWLEGDELPLQRRLSIGGPGTLPGFDFRKPIGVTDHYTCAGAWSGQPGGLSQIPVPRGSPAQCERVALAQLEFRGDLHIDIGSDDPDDDGNWGSFDRRGTWVVFADAGRGWLVGSTRVGDLQYRARAFPDISSFRTDVGAGIDVGLLGFYVAKAISDPKEPANFLVRLKHRF